MLSILSYLLLFRLDEMGWSRVRPLLESQPLNRVHTLLGFLLDKESTSKWLVEDWSSILDRSFVLDQMLGGLARAQPQLGKWLKSTHSRAFGNEGGAQAGPAANLDAKGAGDAVETASVSPKHAAKPPTVPQSPRITKPRPRILPEPIRMEQGVKARPIPSWLNNVTMADLEAQAEARRAKAAEAAASATQRAAAPKLHATRETIDKVRAEVQAERDAELQFGGQRARPVPALPATGADVRLNAAAILREEFLLRQRQEKEAAVVRRFEAELRDEAEFAQWRARMQVLDEQAKAAAVARRKEEMAQSAAQAQSAVAKDLEGKRRVAERMREASALTAELVARSRGEARAVHAGAAAQVREARRTLPKEAAERAERARQAAAEAVRAESKAAEAELERRAEAEVREAADRIRRLRAEVEVKPPRAQVLFDPTTTAGHGFLGEVSMLEAKERLAMEQARQEEETERRRREIMTARREEQIALEQKMRSIRRVRASAAAVARSASERRVSAHHSAEGLTAVKHEAAVVSLEAKLRAKKEARDAERRGLAEESRKIARRNLFLGAAKSAIEQRQHEQLRANREASAKREAARAAEEFKAEARSKKLDSAERGRARRAQRQHRLRVRARATEAMRVGAVESDAVRAGERAEKREAFFTAAAREERLSLKRAGDNVYATTVKEDAADAARARWGGFGRDEAHEQVLQARMARMTAEQAELTGMADTMLQRSKIKPALAKAMGATRQQSLRVSQQLAGGLAASRSNAAEASRARPAKAEHWRQEESAEGGERPLELTLSRVQGEERARVGVGLAERRDVLMATRGAAESWMALRR